MEKLQQALDRARSTREVGGAPAAPAQPGGPAAATARTPRAPRPVAAPAVDTAWRALQPLRPDPALLKRNRIVTAIAGREATAFDILRTKILLQMRRNGWRRLAITSPDASCGKTTTALNLSLGLARQSELRTLLMEMDLRRPSMSRLLGHRPEIDITEMLTGARGFEEQALRLGENLALSMARRPSKDPTRYMISSEAQDCIDRLQHDYAPDVVIFDLPPLLVSDDTRAFLGNVDCALMVARAEQTSVAQIDACEREIAEHTNVLGVVLSHCRFGDATAGYEYG